MDSHDSGYCPSSTSSTSSTDSISFTPPRGPISAFDYRPANKRAIFFEERQNVLVEHNVESLDDALMVVPTEYAFSTHFWARIYYVNNNTILALLKEHLQKEFILVSFRLKRKDHTIVKLDEKRTEISTEGYQISSQRGRTDGEFCFGLCSRATHLGHRRKHSERANFALQLSELREQEEKRSGIQLTPGQAKRSASSDVHPQADANSSAPVTIKKHESVMLTVKCAADSGAIAMNILLVGRKTLGIKRTTFGPLWDFFRFKYTARLNLDEAENFVEPIRTDKNALFVNGIHPNTAILVPMQDIPAASAPLAAIEQLQRITGLSTLLGEEKAENVQQVEIVGESPPSMEHALWSNLEVVGKVAFLVIQDENLVSSLWKLHIEREDGSALRWEQVSKTLPLPADDYKAERFSVRVHDNKLCLRGCGSRKESPDEMNQFCEAFDLVNIAAS